MQEQNIQIIETVVVGLLYVIAWFANKTIINNTLKRTHIERTRRRIIIKAINLLNAIAAGLVVAGIWGLKQHQIALFASSVLTALGIAFFAQWSLLSNITSSIILFFNHPLRLGDTIRVMDKEYSFEGEVVELTYFFLHVKTKNGEVITIPNSIVLQKSVAVMQTTKEPS
jgi:small-conductance mechanosensitive channel